MNNWTSQPGPHLRTDVFDVYIFRVAKSGVEILQLRRAEVPLLQTWQPVMGHVEGSESTPAAMWREVEEEVGLVRTHARGAWALEGVHPFYLASRDAILLSVRFAIEVGAEWVPRLNHEHDAVRWVPLADVRACFMWPGQIAALDELRDCILNPNSLAREHLRLPH
ncbi:MAG: NUDIX domain-containing protein [Planctomycetes bacterium]|nr:NUDIX domain-containing protein [Planctomycetota bacterium]